MQIGPAIPLTLLGGEDKMDQMEPSSVEVPKRQQEDKPAEDLFSVEDTETVVKTAVNSVLAGTDYKP